MSELSIERLPRGEVSTQGAQVLRWRAADGRPVLFLSAHSEFAAGKPIRGGVPIVFPWFGDDPERRGRPAHGFARRLPWWLDPAHSDRAQGRLCFVLEDDPATRAQWPNAFAARLSVRLGDALEFAFAIDNRGDAPCRCEVALHSYFAVGDVRRVEVRGLAGAGYVDKVDGGRRKQQREEVVRCTGEIDRIYEGVPTACTLLDPVLQRAITVDKQGAPSTIVWNPWSDKTARLSDLGDDEWPQFLCLESGCVGGDALVLPPGGSHRLSVRITCS